MFDLFKRRRRQLARERAQARREYQQRVAMGESPQRALVALEGGKGDPRRQGAVYVFGAGERRNGHDRDVIA